jgi:Predicted membrane protein (DUF2207).
MIQLTIVLPVCFLLIVLAMWFAFGKDEQVIDHIEYYPLKGYNSVDIGFFYKGKANTPDVVSLLIYLANRGYIKITEKSETSLFSTVERFTITKLKDYDGDNPNERLFMNGLFKCRASEPSIKEMFSGLINPEAVLNNDTADGLTEIRLEDLKNSFYLTLNAIIKNMNKKENKENIFEKNSMNKRLPIAIMCISAFLLITVRPMLEYHDDPFAIFALPFPAIGFLMIFLAFFTDSFKMVIVNGVPTTKRSSGFTFGLLFGLIFGGVPFAFLVLPALLLKTAYLVAFLIGMTCIVLMLLLDKYMKKRTSLGNELLGKIKGFKRFLETADRHKIEQIAGQSPNYFHNVLPYAYVLGISDIYVKKFENIAIKQPDWYTGSDHFNHASFARFFNEIMKSGLEALASNPNSDSSSSRGTSHRRSVRI